MTDGDNWHVADDIIAGAAEVLRNSKTLVVLTGAGISKESGIPTFRDAQEGLWAQFDPTELATPRAFQRNPKRVWDWYHHRRGLLADAQPNPGHYAIVELEHLLPHCVVVTQNIDGLHQKAGSQDVIAVHGDIRRNKCFNNCRGNPTYINIYGLLDWDAEEDEGPPRCPHCGAYVRPDVVWYEEALPPGLFERASLLAMQADVMLVVGTSGVTYPVASIPFMAREHDTTIIEVNPDITPITYLAQWHLPAPSGAILPQVVARIKAGQDSNEADGTEPPDA